MQIRMVVLQKTKNRCTVWPGYSIPGENTQRNLRHGDTCLSYLLRSGDNHQGMESAKVSNNKKEEALLVYTVYLLYTQQSFLQ